MRSGMGVVSQDVTLSSGIILDNIAPGIEKPDLNRIVSLCEIIGLSDFIHRLPQGFMTPLMDGSGNLSGGQKQKISIARALYRDTQIIIMDEPSSAMDPQSESDLSL